MDHPDQIKGKSVRLLRNFAKAFNKALNYRIGNVAEILEGITNIVEIYLKLLVYDRLWEIGVSAKLMFLRSINIQSL